MADTITSGRAWLILRPEAIDVSADSRRSEGVPGTIVDAAFRGTGFDYRIRVAGLDELVKAEPPGRELIPLGSTVRLNWTASDSAFLSRTDGQ